MKRNSIIPIFIICFVGVGVFFVLSKVSFFNPLFGEIAKITTPIQSSFYATFQNMPLFSNSKIKALEEKNLELRGQLADHEILLKENQALHDQFQTEAIPHARLLPVSIIGAPGFIPGVSTPEILIVDNGSQSGIKPNQAAIYKNVLLGKVSNVSQNSSQITLVTKKAFSFTAKTAKTQALGIIKGGNNNEIILDNVLLSDDLQKGDLVMTHGDIGENGLGLPPNLIVGEIVSVDKKPSALFQSAKLKSLVDVTKLSTIFIVTQ